jgi:hypothetical protein
MKIDLGSLGFEQSKPRERGNLCWVCQVFLGYKNKQMRFHTNKSRTDVHKLDAVRIHNELLRRREERVRYLVGSYRVVESAVGRWIEQGWAPYVEKYDSEIYSACEEDVDFAMWDLLPWEADDED